jgi:hypothetical protein
MRARLIPFLLLAGLALPAAAAKTFCCLDENGSQACGDVLPPQCYGRAYREVSESGMTLRQVEAPLSAEQRALREAQAKKKKEDDRIALEERRKNQALLDTYGSDKDIDVMRDRVLTDLELTRKQALGRYQEALQRKQHLDNEAEFYKRKPMPLELSTEIKSNDLELVSQQAAAAAKLKEMEAARARFAEDKKRYLELMQGKSGARIGAQ